MQKILPDVPTWNFRLQWENTMDIVTTLQVVIRFFPELLSFTSVPSLYNNRRSSLVIAFLLLTPKLSHNIQFQSEQLRNYMYNQL